jgi:hypothetical protein
MPLEFDRNKSLQELDGEDWGEPQYDSGLVIECHRLHRIPLRDFTAGNLRIMIGQQFGLEYLVPLALELLWINPRVEGDFYEGDLLCSVLKVDPKFWHLHPEWRDEVAAIAERTITSFWSPSDAPTYIEIDAVTNAYEQFQRNIAPQ